MSKLKYQIKAKNPKDKWDLVSCPGNSLTWFVALSLAENVQGNPSRGVADLGGVVPPPAWKGLSTSGSNDFSPFDGGG
jgi:hypothetical protein